LASSFKKARKGAAQAVSAIALREFEQNRWGEIIINLSTNALNEVHEYKMSALETLRYICEEVNELNETQVNSILHALVSNLAPTVDNEEVRLLAITGLESCIRFCRHNFGKEAERHLLIDNVVLNCMADNDQVRNKAVQCLLEILRYFYDNIDPTCFHKMGTVTLDIIKKDNAEDLIILAIEFWCSLCDEEILRLKKDDIRSPCKNIIPAASGLLMTTLLESLKRISLEYENDGGIPVAAACCINLIAQILKDNIINPVLAYITANIGSTDWQSRNAALLSFVAITKGPSKERMQELVKQALHTLTIALKDTKPQIRETAAWGFSKIANDYSDLFNNNLIKVLIESLQDKPRISNQICIALFNVYGHLNDVPYFDELLVALWKNGFRDDAFSDNVNLALSSFSALTKLINHATNSTPMLKDLFKGIIDQLEAINKKTFKISGKVQQYQCYLCSSLQVLIGKLADEIAQPLAEQIMEIITMSFKLHGIVYEEGLSVLTELILTKGKCFLPYMDMLSPYLLHGLQAKDDVSLCKAAINSIIDLSRLLEQEIAKYLHVFLPLLLNLLRESEAERSTKILALSAIGDLAITTKDSFEPYLKDTLDMLASASSIALQPPNDDDPDLQEYIEELCECLIESYAEILYSSDSLLLQEYLADIFKFVAVLSSNTNKLKLSLTRSICGLIGDLAKKYKGRIKNYLSALNVDEMIKVLRSSTEPEYAKLASWVASTVSNALNDTFY